MTVTLNGELIGRDTLANVSWTFEEMIAYASRDAWVRPGDILVWPFTFPPRSTQHIGIAVQQNGRLMLLSNLAGRLGTTEIEPGYVAFWRAG